MFLGNVIVNRLSALAVGLVISALMACVSGIRAEDWPQWRGPRGDGSWHGPKLPERWPEAGLKTAWKRDIGGGYAGISVADGRVFVLDRQVKREPSDDPQKPGRILEEHERLLCLDAESGREVWVHAWPQPYRDLDYGNGPRAAPTVFGDVVLTLGALGRLNCLRASDGRVLWTHDLVRDFRGRVPDWGYAASPRVHNGLVLVVAGGDDGHCLLAFDLQSGELRWKTLSDEAGYAWPVPVKRSDHEQLVLWTPSYIRGVDAASGRSLWAWPYEVTYGVSIATPIVHEDLVLVCGYWHGSRAVRLGAKPGDADLAWQENRFLRGLMSQPLYRNGFVYLLDKQYGLTCFELKNGTKRWDDGNTLTKRDRNPHASLVWLNDEDRIMALNAEGQLVLARIDPDGYREQSRTQIIGETWAHPAFAGRRVYARSDREIVAIELPVAAGGTGVR